MWPEGLPPGPAGPGKGMETLGSLPLVTPTLTLTAYKAEQGWLPSLLSPVRRSRGKRRVKTGVKGWGSERNKSLEVSEPSTSQAE